MKIYTKTGDDGTTGLIGGSRVAKSDARIECYGTVDELNAALGFAAVVCGPDLQIKLHAIQNELFNIGSHLAAPDPAKAKGLPVLEIAMITRLESQIDQAEAELTPLRQFILPGGSEPAARLHLARTICRRAERLLVLMNQQNPVSTTVSTSVSTTVSTTVSNPISPTILTYLNRLSDWLFVQARWMNQQAGIADIPWVK